MKTFAAITTGGWVLFIFDAVDSVEARQVVRSLRKRSDTIVAIRLLRSDDMPYTGTTFERR